MYETSDYLAIDLISKASYLYRFEAVLHAAPVNMNTLVLIFLICYMSPISGAEDDTDAYCFKYTWPGPMYLNNSKEINCTDIRYKGVPCIYPIIPGNDSDPPSTVDLWRKWDRVINPNSYICPLRNGFTCIRYSYIYNNAVLNTSHYCGKIIEDKTVAITSGCFYYEVDGHIIEVCACRSRPGAQPCNIATKQSSSIVVLLTGVIILFYNFI